MKLEDALLHHQAGRKNEALSIYKKLLETDPNNTDALYFSGLIMYEKGQYQEALGYAERAAKVLPDANLYKFLGDMRQLNGNNKEALLAYETAIELNPDSAELYYCAGVMYQRLKRAKNAQSFFLKSINIDPNYAPPYSNLGITYVNENRFQEALNCYEKALKINPENDDVHYNIGNLLYKIMDFDQAINYYQKAIKLNPNNKLAIGMLGVICSKAGKTKEALNLLNLGLEQEPNNFEFTVELGNAYYQLGNLSTAKEYYRKAKAINHWALDYSIRCKNDSRYELWQEIRDERIKYSQPSTETTFAVILFGDGSVEKNNEAEKLQKHQSFKKFEVLSANSLNFSDLKGKFTHVCFIEKGDSIHNDGLLAMENAISKYSDIELFYTDEDVIENNGKRHSPYFKTEFARYLLYSHNYMNAFLCLRLSDTIINELNATGKITQNNLYKLVLNLSTQNIKIKRIPDVLYHRHIKNHQKNLNTSCKKIIEDFIKKESLNAKIIDYKAKNINLLKFYNTSEPKISIIIPFKDKADFTKVCTDSIKKVSTYKNYEIILLNNRSTESKTFEYIEQCNKNPKIKVINADIVFNFAKLCNMGAAASDGDYLLFLNNDMEVISPDWLETSLCIAERPDVGVVGAKLLYRDNTIQHAGMVRRAGFFHINRFLSDCDGGYMHYANLVREYSAVTGAFQMVSRNKFYEIGCFDERFPVEKNDTEICLRFLEAGYLNIYNPHAMVYHYEKTTRAGLKPIDEPTERYYQQRHKDAFSKPDPFYSPHHSIHFLYHEISFDTFITYDIPWM